MKAKSGWFITTVIGLCIVFASTPSDAWINPAPSKWLANGAANERAWQSSLSTAVNPQAIPPAIIVGPYKPDLDIPPVQFSNDIVLEAGRDTLGQAAQAPWACLDAHGAGILPTHLLARLTSGAQAGGVVRATSINTLTGRTCDAVVSAPLLSGSGGPDGQMIIAKVVSFAAPQGLHILFIDLQCVGGANCNWQFSLVQDVLVGSLPLKAGTNSLWWEPNKGQGFSALIDPLNPLPYYDDVAFISLAPGTHESRMISIDFGAAAGAARWQNRIVYPLAANLPPACPGPQNCEWEPIYPAPEWPGFIRGRPDLAEFAKIGPNAVGHFTGFTMVDSQNSKPWFLVVDFWTQTDYYAKSIPGAVPINVPPYPPVFGSVCYTLDPAGPVPPIPFMDGPHPSGPQAPVPGEMGVCIISYGDNVAHPLTVEKVTLQYDPVWGPIVACYPVKMIVCSVLSVMKGANTGLAGNLRGANLPVYGGGDVWVISENPVPKPFLEIQRMDAFPQGFWGMAVNGAPIQWGAGFGGNAAMAKVESSYTGTLDGNTARLWITVYDDSAWVCGAIQTWGETLIMISSVNGVWTVQPIDTFVVWAPPGPNGCAIEPYNQPWSPAVILVEDPVTARETVWLISSNGVAPAWFPTGGVTRFYPL
jgi:hypothetical protein